MEKGKRVLGRAAILGAEDLPTAEVEVPEWGGVVLVRSLTAAERDRFEVELNRAKEKRGDAALFNIRAKMMAAVVVDEDGRQVFNLADVETLGQKSGRALDRIFMAATKLAGMRQEDAEEMEENFAGTPGGG